MLWVNFVPDCIHQLVFDDKTCFWISICPSHAKKAYMDLRPWGWRVCLNISCLHYNQILSCKDSISSLACHIDMLRVCPYGHVFKYLPENWCSSKMLWSMDFWVWGCYVAVLDKFGFKRWDTWGIYWGWCGSCPQGCWGSPAVSKLAPLSRAILTQCHQHSRYLRCQQH